MEILHGGIRESFTKALAKEGLAHLRELEGLEQPLFRGHRLEDFEVAAMIRSGFRIIKKDPLTGVGPDMVVTVYASYRDPNAVQQLNSHLHNVPLQIAAERGLPALAIWIWFIVTLLRDFVKNRRTGEPSLNNGALAVTVAMLAAGMFEYNFGDSEFLMLFLVLVTLPYAASRSTPASSAA